MLVQGFCQFVRLIVAPVAQVVGVLGHGCYGVWQGQAGHGVKHKAPQQRSEVQVAVKLEAQQGVAQGVLIQTVKGNGAPRRGILQARAAQHIALVGIGGRQPATGAARPGVGREQRSAAGAELAVCKSGCGNFWRGVGDGQCVALRSLSRPGWKQGREGAQTVYTAVLGQPKPVLPVGKPEGEVRDNACHAVVVGRTYGLWQARLHGGKVRAWRFQESALWKGPRAARKRVIPESFPQHFL